MDGRTFCTSNGAHFLLNTVAGKCFHIIPDHILRVELPSNDTCVLVMTWTCEPTRAVTKHTSIYISNI